MKVEHEDENDIEDDLQKMISDQKDSKKKTKEYNYHNYIINISFGNNRSFYIFIIYVF